MVDFEIATGKVEKEYNLTCKIKSKTVWFDDIDSRNRVTRQSTEIFFLVPQTSTHQVMFFDAWLPSVEEETYEMVAILSHPIAKPVRLGLKMWNKNCPEHHLILMTPDVEDEVRRYVDHVRNVLKKMSCPEINLTIMPASMEDEFNV